MGVFSQQLQMSQTFYKKAGVQAAFAALLTCIVALSVTILFVGCKAKVSAEQRVLWAAGMDDLDLLKELEAEGKSLDCQDPLTHWTPLITAIFHEQTNVIDYLVTRKINLNLYDSDGYTALMWAIDMGDTNTVRLLLERGADVNFTNALGQSAFACADARPNRTILIQWLNEHKVKGP